MSYLSPYSQNDFSSYDDSSDDDGGYDMRQAEQDIAQLQYDTEEEHIKTTRRYNVATGAIQTILRVAHDDLLLVHLVSPQRYERYKEALIEEVSQAVADDWGDQHLIRILVKFQLDVHTDRLRIEEVRSEYDGDSQDDTSS